MSAQKKHNFFGTIFKTFRYRNFRIFITGQGVSLVGTWMQQIAMSWLVYRMTGSVLLLGVVSFSSQLPLFLLSPFTGVIADRWDRRRTLIVTQTLFMAQALILAVLTITGVVAVWHVIVLGVFLGCINSLDVPCRQSFVVEMVERKENLANAIALNSLFFNSARLIGPSIAGLIIALAGEGVCFLINGITFLAVIVSLFLIKTPARRAGKAETHILTGLKEGFVYAFGFIPIKMILFLISVISVITGDRYCRGIWGHRNISDFHKSWRIFQFIIENIQLRQRCIPFWNPNCELPLFITHWIFNILDIDVYRGMIINGHLLYINHIRTGILVIWVS